VTFVPVPSQLCSILDEQEPDNTWDQARLILLDALAQTHNFCNPGVSDFSGDQDWIRFQGPATGQISVMASPESGSPAYLKLTLYRKVGNDLVEIKQAASSGYSLPVWLTWTALDPQEYYLQATSVIPGLIGTGTGYWLQVYPGSPRIIVLPVVFR
jgi:hypothetical protein